MLEKIYNGIFLTYENAIDLYEDAEILNKAGKITRSYTFYHFSFEEIGRFYILAQVLFQVLKNEIKLSEINYGYLKKLGFENHIKKLDESVLKLFAFPIHNSVLESNNEQTKKLLNLYDNLKSKIEEFNNLKNRSIYISHINNNSLLSESLK